MCRALTAVSCAHVEAGLLGKGRMEVPPFGPAGWYKSGPNPGAAGPVVVMAHMDSTRGRDVLYRLKDLHPGHEILISGESGDVATFVMGSKERQLNTDLPRERIWNDTWRPVIRLITCGGGFPRRSSARIAQISPVSGRRIASYFTCTEALTAVPPTVPLAE